MGDKTIIAWTDRVANFWMGCTKISPGCKNCYAETLTKNRMGLAVWGPKANRQRVKSVWDNVRRWNRDAEKAGQSARVFCMSLGDFFEDHPDADRIRPEGWDLIRATPALDWQILTKRPERIAENLPADWGNGWPHVWLGTSIENADYAFRADHLRKVPAAVRFISYEPALGPLADAIDLTGISWQIYGGESGPGHRAEDKQWARDMHAKCAASGTAFFHKQSAGYRTELGIELDGKIVREYPQERRLLRKMAAPTLFPELSAPAR